MTERLRGFDAAFLSLETPTNHMHVATALVLDPSTSPDGWSLAKVREVVGSRLHLAPVLRRRIVAVPFGLHHPVWVDDAEFDLDQHVVSASIRPPGGDAEVAELVARIMGRPLARSRPLWELSVVEGVAGGRVAVVAKIHHALIDGVAGAALLMTLVDTQPDVFVTAPEPEPWCPAPMPTDAELLGDAIAAMTAQPALLAATLRRTVETVGGWRRLGQVDGSDLAAPFRAPRTSLNTLVGARRQVGFADVALADVKAVKDAFGVTVNDVVLAMVSGALRTWLDERGERPDGDLVALVPISVRPAGQGGRLGNQVSPMLVSLATTEGDPGARLAAIARSAQAAKAQEREVGSAVLGDWAEVLSPALVTGAARLASSLRLADHLPPPFNLSVSNVPGPPMPLYLAGARIEAAYPLGPVLDGSALNVTVLSHAGRLGFGLTADHSVAGLSTLGAGLAPALEELRQVSP